MSFRSSCKLFLAALLLACGTGLDLHAATADRVHAVISNAQRTPLSRSVPPRALAATDLGAADPALKLEMTLRFNLSDANQAALTELVLEQQEPSSPNFHQWLTPEQYASRFGLSNADLATVSSWLTSQGFTITGTARSATFLTFSGTAAQVQQAFATTIHNVSLGGQTHFANLTDPALPSAFSGVVSSIGGLHDFKLVPRIKAHLVPAPSDSTSGVHSDFTSSVSGNHFIAPGDFYTIYDESPLFSSTITGTGITIAVMGQTDISLADVAAFRAASGLTVNAPTVKLYGRDPGTSSGDIDEAQLDVEWSGAAAPSASILYVNSGDVLGTSLTQAIDNNLAPIMTISYGDCEVNYGQSSLNAFNLLFQQANAQGITIVGPGGDSGAADCDYNATSASQGLAVDFPASSPFVTGVGGTMFNEGTGTYFSTSNNSNAGSAISYIPEAVWNETTAQGQLAAGGGGLSAFFAKPTWQVGTGVPADSSRDVPDLALDAAANHDGFLFCSQSSCTSGFRNSGGFLNVVGGTSIATPSLAGIIGLVEQKIASRIGNANPTLYALANSAYYSSIFHDTTTGNNAVPCTIGTVSCLSGGTIGYNAAVGYDLATGWGSIDAFNLVSKWSLVTPLSVGVTTLSNTTLATATPNVLAGTSITFTATTVSGVSGTNAVPTGSVQFYVDNIVNGTAVALSSGTATFTLATSALASGAHTVSVAYLGDATYAGSKGSKVIDVTSDFTIAGSASSITVASGATAAGVTYTLKSLSTFAGSVTLTASSSTLNASGGFSVNPVVLTAGSSGTSVFTLSAYVSSAQKSTLQQSTNGSARRPWEMAGGGVAFASMLLLVLPRRNRRLRGAAGIFSIVLVLVVAAGLSGCSSSGTSVSTTNQVNSAAGTYLVTITATSGSLSHATTLNVVIQ